MNEADCHDQQLRRTAGCSPRRSRPHAPGAARGPRPRPAAQRRRAGRAGIARLDKLRAPLPARALQEAGRHDQAAFLRGGARHARPPQQRLRRVDERAASAGQEGGSRVSHGPQLHCHRLPASVTLEEPAGSPVRYPCGRQRKVSRSTRNGLEPAEISRRSASPLQVRQCGVNADIVTRAQASHGL